MGPGCWSGDGVVGGPIVQVGTFALANFSSTQLMLIADMATINVEVNVDETDITNVKPSQKAKVKVDALGEMEIEGRLMDASNTTLRVFLSHGCYEIKGRASHVRFRVICVLCRALAIKRFDCKSSEY